MSSVSSYETESAATERPTVAAFQSIDPELPVRFVGFWTAVLMPFVLCYLRRQTRSAWILSSSFHVRTATSITPRPGA